MGAIKQLLNNYCLVIYIPFLLIGFTSYANSLDLSFEKSQSDIPSKWTIAGGSNYNASLDYLTSHSGQTSAMIENIDGIKGFKAWTFKVPANFQGKLIKLVAYIKTHNITDGYAGIWMKVDPSLAFDNMNKRGLTGTHEWTSVEVELNLSAEKAESISFGGLLTGKGKAWFDSFEIFIDGIQVKNFKYQDALLDRRFDLGSKVDLALFDNTRLENIELLGKFWGFLKYHHPQIAKGNYNWDYELLDKLPNYVKHSEIETRNKYLLDWFKELGPIPKNEKSIVTDSNSVIKPSMSWLNDYKLSKELRASLVSLYNNRHVGKHFYIARNNKIGNPIFKNESGYGTMPYPDTGFRLLALFRYWNIVNYYFPYKYLIKNTWDKILLDYIESFLYVENELEYEKAVLQLIGELNDSHANIWAGHDKLQIQRGTFYPPMQLRFVENKLVVYSLSELQYSKPTNLQIGDIITRINGVKVEDIVEESLNLYPASNYPTQLRGIAKDILRSNSQYIDIEYMRESILSKTKLELLEEKPSYSNKRKNKIGTESSYSLIDDNIGYIDITLIKNKEIDKIIDKFINTDGIIIDLRGYPNEFVPFTLGGFLVSKPTPFAKFSKPNFNNPGEFSYHKNKVINNQGIYYKGKVVILVNEYTQSQAEYTAMALQANKNSIVIGSQTAGADGNISRFSLPGGIHTSISGLGVYYPNGEETQQIGIKPDIKLSPTIDSIRLKKDLLLNKAIELINK